ncbi:MAG: hypothetical protein OWU33_13595 [Firmicutes bacterium]|nr:hypothetical protein [Bacillota bacterium]
MATHQDVDEHLKRLQEAPGDIILKIAQKAQKNKIVGFTGFELKKKNVERFRNLLSERCRQGEPQTTMLLSRIFVHGNDTPDDEEASSLDANLEELVNRVQVSRGELLQTVQELVHAINGETNQHQFMLEQLGQLQSSVEALRQNLEKAREDYRVDQGELINEMADLFSTIRQLKSAIAELEGGPTG